MKVLQNPNTAMDYKHWGRNSMQVCHACGQTMRLCLYSLRAYKTTCCRRCEHRYWKVHKVRQGDEVSSV